MKLLIIDDDVGFVRVLRRHLAEEGYEILEALRCIDGLRLAYSERPDLILLDIKMPDLDGREMCRRLRDFTDTPVIFISGLASEVDILRSFHVGADDYLVKPFRIGELKARIHALLRRVTPPPHPPQHYQDDVLRIDPVLQIVEKRGKRIELSAIEYKLLMLLVERRGYIVPRQVLASAIWDGADEKRLQYLMLYIGYLRRRIEDDPGNPAYIQTKRGVGYGFRAAGDSEPMLEWIGGD